MPLCGGRIGLATVRKLSLTKGISEVRASHTITPVFDDPNLVSASGLVPVMRLAESAGLSDLLAEHLSVGSPNASAKAGCVIGGVLAGADSIDDLDMLRHGAMPRLFGGLRAPSTLGTYLRSFTHSHVQQLDAVSSRLLAGLAARAPGLLAGAGPEGIAFIDVDDSVRAVHGYAKQAAAYGYTGVRGLNFQIAALSTPLVAPVVAAARLRRGNTASHAGSGRLLAQAITTGRRAGVAGQIMARADSAHFCHTFVGAAIRAKIWFSVTARMNTPVTAAIAAIGEDAWTPISYPHAIWEEAEQCWISDAEVAEVPITVFTSRRKADHVTCRLVVRRVKRLNPQTPAGKGKPGSVQEELFATYRHHGFITNSTLGTIEADQRHRDHAVVEQVIAELKDGPIAHLPSGSYAANAAWLAHAVIAFNLARTSGVIASNRHARARWATLRTHLINVPGRVASSARRLTLHLPLDWPWADAWQALFAAATGPPATVTA